jgi:hypothetical protein
MKRIGIAAWIVLFGILSTAGILSAGQNGNSSFSGQQTLTAAEAGNLVFMREEEKLARDVYLYLFDAWGQWVFENIAASEQQHMDAVKNLLDKYNLADPAAGNGEGVFTNPQLQKLYDSLTRQGSATERDALYVGATIEDMDIYDLQGILSETDKPDFVKVCDNLMKGSRNHLRAFVGQIELLGGTYEAQYLPQEAVDAILEAPRETGSY